MNIRHLPNDVNLAGSSTQYLAKFVERAIGAWLLELECDPKRGVITLFIYDLLLIVLPPDY